jgi:hypothetical protein
MTLIHHVLLAAIAIAELLGAEQAELAYLDASGDVGKQTLEVNQTIHV